MIVIAAVIVSISAIVVGVAFVAPINALFYNQHVLYS